MWAELMLSPAGDMVKLTRLSQHAKRWDWRGGRETGRRTSVSLPWVHRKTPGEV